MAFTSAIVNVVVVVAVDDLTRDDFTGDILRVTRVNISSLFMWSLVSGFVVLLVLFAMIVGMASVAVAVLVVVIDVAF